MSRLLETHALVTNAGRAKADDPAPHRAGDVVQLEIHAVLDAEASARWPSRDELQKALGESARVLGDGSDIAAQNALGIGSAQARSWSVQLLLPPGEGSLGPIPLAVVGPDGAELERGDVPAVTLMMETVLEAAVAQDLDAKAETPDFKAEMTRVMAAPRGPWQLRSQWPLEWIALALVLAALFAWIAWKIAKRPRRVAPPPPPETAELVARRRLAALAANPGLGLGREGAGERAFHVELADILRRYLSSRLGTDVSELTTDEVRRMLRGEMRSHAALALGATSHAGEARGEIIRLLTACDLVKFARHVPAPIESLELLRDVGRLVDMTTSVAAAATSARPSPPEMVAGAVKAPATPGSHAVQR